MKKKNKMNKEKMKKTQMVVVILKTMNQIKQILITVFILRIGKNRGRNGLIQ